MSRIKRTNSFQLQAEPQPHPKKLPPITNSQYSKKNSLKMSQYQTNNDAQSQKHENYEFKKTDSKIEQRQRQKDTKNFSVDSLFDQQEHADKIEDLRQQPISVGAGTSSTQIIGKGKTMNNNMTATNVGNKIPDAVIESIRKLATGKKPINPMTTSKFARAIIQKYKNAKKKNMFLCEICQCQYEEQKKTKLSKCAHEFCETCSRYYVQYKIQRFQQVQCPAEGCPETLDISGTFYESLSQKLKDKYSKVHGFHIVSKDQTKRICPKSQCDGIITIQQGIQPKCQKCKGVFCPLCFFPPHQGSCAKNQVQFFQNNFKFRQCSKCKAVIQKAVGCNHITCRCKYQFCYLCGARWTGYDHRCGNLANNNAAAQPQAVQQPLINNNACACCNCCECCDCGGENLCFIITKILIKILLFPIFLFFVLVLLLKSLLALVGLLLVTILMGMFPYTFQIICEQNQGYKTIILIILYPLVMFVGIGRAIGDFYCDMLDETREQLPNDLGGLAEAMFCW